MCILLYIPCNTQQHTLHYTIQDKYAELDSSTSQHSSKPPPSSTTSLLATRLKREEATRLLTCIKDLTEEYELHKKYIHSIHNILLQYKDQFIRNLDNANTNTMKGQNYDPSTVEKRETTDEVEMEVEVSDQQHSDALNPKKSGSGHQNTTTSSTVYYTQHNIQTIELILHTCISQRILLSPTDAIYTIQYFKILQYINTPNYYTLLYYNKYIINILPMIYCVTEAEAGCIGHALCEMLSDIYTYNNNMNIYNSECTKIGFHILDYQKGHNSDPTTTTTSTVEPVKYRSILHSEFTLATKHYMKCIYNIISTALYSQEFMYLRAVLIVLAKVRIMTHMYVYCILLCCIIIT